MNAQHSVTKSLSAPVLDKFLTVLYAAQWLHAFLPEVEGCLL